MQWEFGPVGGDSTLGRKAEATAAGLLSIPFLRSGKPKASPAEIREQKVGAVCNSDSANSWHVPDTPERTILLRRWIAKVPAELLKLELLYR